MSLVHTQAYRLPAGTCCIGEGCVCVWNIGQDRCRAYSQRCAGACCIKGGKGACVQRVEQDRR